MQPNPVFWTEVSGQAAVKLKDLKAKKVGAAPRKSAFRSAPDRRPEESFFDRLIMANGVRNARAEGFIHGP